MKGTTYRTANVLMAVVIILAFCFQAHAIVHESWSNRYFSLTRSDDAPCGVAADSMGNIYVAGQFGQPGTGQDYALMKIGLDGSQQWAAYYDGGFNGTDFATDFLQSQDGSFYLTGGSQGPDDREYATVKFNSQGILQWEARYSLQPWGGNSAQAMTIDEGGNIYVTGSAFGDGTEWDIVTIKYNASGVQQWIARYNGAGNPNDEGVALAVDNAGNVYVAGRSWPNYWDQFDYVIIKYDAQGNQRWANTYDGPGNEDDEPVALKLDQQANVYVTGTSKGTSSTGYDMATIKYNSAGVLQWLVRYDSPSHADEHATDLEIDADGNIIITGWMQGMYINAAFLTFKYNPNGSLQWFRIYQQGVIPWSSDCGARALALDADRNIYVTGSVPRWDNPSECLTIKYNTSGDQRWVARHIDERTVSSWGGTWGKYITFDPQINLVVAGDFCFGGDIEDRDFWVAKYRQTPEDLNVSLIPAITPVQIPAQGGSFNYEEQTINPVVDELRVDNWWKVIYPNLTTNRFLGPVQDILQLGNQSTGRSQRVPGSVPAGTYQYVLNIGEYPGVIWAADTLTFTKLSSGEGAEIGDWGFGDDGGTRSVVSLSGSGTTPTTIISPNPFNPTTTIRFNLPEAARVTFEVFDINGRSVGVGLRPDPFQGGDKAPPLRAWYPAGTHEITFDGSGLASGVYLYRLTTSGSGVSPTLLSGKMVLLK
jgi:uncharacterized delta-60 repeat protein